jgi:Kef-type K+ transport system membrane component KefB
MRRALALILRVAPATLISSSSRASEPHGVAFAFGFALIAAALAGSLFEQIKLPRITGYLLFGVLCGPYVLNIISPAMARELTFVNGIAIALIAFIAGLELNLRRLRPAIGSILRLSGMLLIAMYIGLFVASYLAWPWLPLLPEATGLARIALATLLSALIVSFSPTVTIAVIADSRARGPLSELTLAIVVIADLALIVLFTLSMQFVRTTLGHASIGDVSLLARLAWDIAGSFAFGAILGSLFAFYLRHIGREVTLMLLALCAILSQVGEALHFEPLLAALAAGIVVENIAPPNGDALKDAVERGALPVLVVFFAMAGALLHLEALRNIGAIALAVSLVRLALIRAGAYLGASVSGAPRGISGLVWRG